MGHSVFKVEWHSVWYNAIQYDSTELGALLCIGKMNVVPWRIVMIII